MKHMFFLQEKTATSDALVNDLELLGTAFEDLQEQNMRLLQQLKEKDDANFKLMSERIKVWNIGHMNTNWVTRACKLAA